jgi:hypothetical protein
MQDGGANTTSGDAPIGDKLPRPCNVRRHQLARRAPDKVIRIAAVSGIVNVTGPLLKED